jgi:hypothetical protein
MDDAGVPHDMKVKELILFKTLSRGIIVEVKLVRRPNQFEAALFVDGKYKAGPPLPRPLVSSKDDVTHWMGVRPSVGLTQSEVDKIVEEVEIQNNLYHLRFTDKWGAEYEDA